MLSYVQHVGPVFHRYTAFHAYQRRFVRLLVVRTVVVQEGYGVVECLHAFLASICFLGEDYLLPTGAWQVGFEFFGRYEVGSAESTFGLLQSEVFFLLLFPVAVSAG